MWPNEDTCSNVFEQEISSSEFFQDVGVMVIEGRVPEISKNGRKIGLHSWPLSNNSKKRCCFENNSRNELCKLVSETRSKISSIFTPNNILQIELYGSSSHLNNDVLQRDHLRLHIDKINTQDMILLEKWKIHILEKQEGNDYANVNTSLQAVRSFLHFSQLSAWWNISHGTFPTHVNYGISSVLSTEDFLFTPTEHTFPYTEISKSQVIQITVASLPRMEIPTLLSFLQHQTKNILTFDGGGRSSEENCRSSKIKLNEIKSLKSHKYTSKEIIPRKPIQLGESSYGKRKDIELDVYFSNHFRASNCQKSSYVGEKQLKLDDSLNSECLQNVFKDKPSISKNVHTEVDDSDSSSYSLSDLLERSTSKNTSNESDTSELNKKITKLLQDCVLERKKNLHHSFIGIHKCKEKCNCSDFDQEKVSSPRTLEEKKEPQFIQKDRIRSKSVSPHFVMRTQGNNCLNGRKPMAARRLAMVSGTVPVFNSITGLPISSSPAPIKKPRKISETSHDSSLSRSSSSDELQPTSYGLSKSAPASTHLLGNFEESVLKGRMPVNGTLEGFRAELGASGSFCPKHVILPVKVQYFNLSDDNAPSPYMGHISFDNKRIKKKRYRVPKKGTVQLTIFNPNNTVVKVFIVLYDYEDMPPCSQTFLRQKIVSVRNDHISLDEVQVLHYLVHLSFMTSKNLHVYLHTDIRIIFPQQTPDGQLLTITDGPSDPKYTSTTNELNIDFEDES